jgi:2-dehydropantoate 2-reductase
MSEQPRVAVVGAGAMGSLFGGLLAEGGLDVTLVDVWREHVDAVRAQGLRMVGHGGERHIAVRATADPGECGAVDVVLVQCKAAFTEGAMRSALDAGMFGDATVAISFQNGLGNEEVIAGVVGESRVLGGVTAQGASMEGAGCVRNYADLPSQIGEMGGGVSARAGTVAAAFTAHGLQTTASENIRHDIWKKLMANVGISAASGASNLSLGNLMEVPELRATCYAAVDEARAVAQAEGIALTREESYEVLDRITGAGGTGDNKSSLCVDILNQRPTEIDFINGAVAARGVEHGIATPINATLVALIKALESHYLDAR